MPRNFFFWFHDFRRCFRCGRFPTMCWPYTPPLCTNTFQLQKFKIVAGIQTPHKKVHHKTTTYHHLPFILLKTGRQECSSNKKNLKHNMSTHSCLEICKKLHITNCQNNILNISLSSPKQRVWKNYHKLARVE